METEVAPVTFHCKVAICPVVIVPGIATKLAITGTAVSIAGVAGI
jgi:hypothetical protein